jgi:hypothetical protein
MEFTLIDIAMEFLNHAGLAIPSDLLVASKNHAKAFRFSSMHFLA